MNNSQRGGKRSRQRNQKWLLKQVTHNNKITLFIVQLVYRCKTPLQHAIGLCSGVILEGDTLFLSGAAQRCPRTDRERQLKCFLKQHTFMLRDTATFTTEVMKQPPTNSRGARKTNVRVMREASQLHGNMAR